MTFQLKVTRDTLKIIDKEPAILVEGAWVKRDDFLKRFKMVKSTEVFLIEKQTNEIFTYLDNGKGLEKHDPLNALFFNPISTLDPSDYLKILQVAQKFERPEGADRPHIVQVVSTKSHGPNTNFHNLTFNTKHVWFRIIEWNDLEKKAKVYEVGFTWKTKQALPLVTTAGRFRSPDPWEYVPVEERVVTNIPVTMEEIKALKRFVIKQKNTNLIHGKPVVYQIDKQNCTSFVISGLETIGISLNVKMQVKAALWAFLPDKIKEVGKVVQDGLKKAGQSLKTKLLTIIPPQIINKTIGAIQLIWDWFKKIIGISVAFLLSPIRFSLGGSMGDEGSAFAFENDPPVLLEPPLKNWKNIFKLSSYAFDLPGKLQEWQRSQPSTIITKNPIKLDL